MVRRGFNHRRARCGGLPFSVGFRGHATYVAPDRLGVVLYSPIEALDVDIGARGGTLGRIDWRRVGERLLLSIAR